MKLPVFPLSAYDGRLPVISQGLRLPSHKGVDIDYRALASDPPWTGVNTAQRTRHYWFPPYGTVVVRAAAAGIVRISHELGNGGSVRIAHPSGWGTLYLHLAKRLVDVGQEVRAGEPIGTAGGDRGGFGHLHFELRQGEAPVDPAAALDGARIYDNAGGELGPFARGA